MRVKGFAWQRAANAVARLLWEQGERARAELLFRAVIRDARLEQELGRDKE